MARPFRWGDAAIKPETFIRTSQGAAGALVADDFFDTAGGALYTKVVAGSITGSSVLLKFTRKVGLTGLITPLAVAMKHSIQEKFTGSITMSGTLARSFVTSKAVAGSITMSGTLVRKTMKGLTGSVTAAGAVIKKTARLLTGAFTAAGTVSKRVRKAAFAGSIIASGAGTEIIRLTTRLLGAITAAGSVARTFIPNPGDESGPSFSTFLRRFVGRR